MLRGTSNAIWPRTCAHTIVILACMLAALSLTTAQAAAQGVPARDQTPFEPMRADLLREIVLTEEQSAKIDTLAYRTLLRMRALQPIMATASDAERSQRLTELSSAQADDIRSLLAPEQQQLFDRNRAERAARRRPPPTPTR